MRIAVVIAGLSTPSSSRVLADRLPATTRRPTPDGTDVRVAMIEVHELAHALVDNLLTGFPLPNLREAIHKVTTSGGLIAVTPIFNAAYSALFNAFCDVLHTGTTAGKPTLLGATGGTERHSLALDYAVREVFGCLGAQVALTLVRTERAAAAFVKLVRATERPRVDEVLREAAPSRQLSAG